MRGGKRAPDDDHHHRRTFVFTGIDSLRAQHLFNSIDCIYARTIDAVRTFVRKAKLAKLK